MCNPKQWCCIYFFMEPGAIQGCGSALLAPYSIGVLYSLLHELPEHLKKKELKGGGGMFARGCASGSQGAPCKRWSSYCPENLQVSKPAVSGSGVRKSSSSGSSKMLSMTYSESIRSGINRYHSDQGLNQLPARPPDQVELQRLREQRIAAQIKNMEDFLKMNGLALEECVSYQTGMKYR